MDLLFHLVLGGKKCKIGFAALKGAGATGAAVAGVGAGVVCAVSFGVGCVAMLGAIGAATIASNIPGDKVCGEVDKAQIALQQIHQELEKINSQLKGLSQEVAKLQIFVEYGSAIKRIKDIRRAYNDITFDPQGNLNTWVVDRGYVKKFTDLAFDGVSLKLQLDRLFEMMMSGIYQHHFFCKPEVKQYYNLLMLEGYDLLFRAHAMKGRTHVSDLVNELKERIKRNTELATNQCSKYLKFGFVLCFMFKAIYYACRQNLNLN